MPTLEELKQQIRDEERKKAYSDVEKKIAPEIQGKENAVSQLFKRTQAPVPVKDCFEKNCSKDKYAKDYCLVEAISCYQKPAGAYKGRSPTGAEIITLIGRDVTTLTKRRLGAKRMLYDDFLDVLQSREREGILIPEMKVIPEYVHLVEGLRRGGTGEVKLETPTEGETATCPTDEFKQMIQRIPGKLGGVCQSPHYRLARTIEKSYDVSNLFVGLKQIYE